MNDYMFGVCFNPNIREDNVLHFLDYCLLNLIHPFFSGREEGYVASKTELPGGLDPTEMGGYWSRHQELIRRRALHAQGRYVAVINYTASYRDHLPGVFAVLDELAGEAALMESESEKLPSNPA